MEDVTDLIYSFAGTSLTNQVLDDVLTFGKIQKCMDYVTHGGMKFYVEKICTCDDKCGGIRCRPVLLLNLVGIAEEDFINDESNELLYE